MRNVYTLCFISFLIIFCSIDITSLYAQGNVKTGEITGKIVDEEDGSELIGATVVVKGTGIGVIANVNGEFQLNNVPLGPQVLEFSFVGYSKTEISVNVQEGVLINLTAKLKQSTLLDEVTVVAKADIQYSPIRNSTDVQLISKMKFSEGVMVGISNEQIAKSADRDASQIVQRISGVSLVDRFVVVRGLDPRYNMTLINGLVGPSSEENSRSFSFDALPSGVIDRIEVEKSPGPHLPGMWGGGVIKIFTRSFTTTRAFNFDISTAYRSNGSSFNNNFLTYNASNKDWLAGGASDRSLPAIMRQPNFVYPDFNRYPLENIAIARSPGLQSYVPKEKTSNLDKRINFSYYDSWNIGGKQLNSLTALSYSQENVFRRTKTSTEAGTFLKADNEGSFNPDNHIDSTSHSNGDTWYRERPEQDGIDSLFEEQIRISAVQSLGVILNDNHRISGTLFYNRFGTDQLSIRQGREKDLTGSVVKTYTYQYEQRDIVVGQLGGMHQLSSNSNIEWTLGTSVTTNYVPDLQRYTFFHELNRGLDTTMWQVAYGNNFTETFNTHYVLETKEASATARVDFRKDFTSGFYMKAGGFYDRKERGFYAYQYGTYNNADGNVNGNYTLDHSYKPWMKMDSLQSSSQYATDNLYLRARASQRAYFFDDEAAEGYLAANYSFFNNRLVVYGGARFARYSRTLYDPLNVAYDEDSVRLFGRMFKIPDQVTNYVLPSVMVKYSILDGKYMIRAVYGHSIDRPQFREQGFDQWYNFLTNTNFIGNPSLQNSMIKSADLRFEYYPKGSEYISVGGFYKHIDKPIQLFITPPGTNGAREGFYSNTEYAKVIGVELEVRKKFDFVSFPVIKNLSMNLNASYIWSESKVDLRKSNLRDGTPSGIYQFIRLQGASPYLVNFALYYERLSSGTLFSAIYNLTWDRVKDYGGSPDIGNQVEGRIHRVDLVLKQRITKFLTAKFSIQDLLNRPIRIYRDENSNYSYDPGIQNATPNDPENPLRYRGDYVERSFKPGTYYSLGLSLNLQKNK